MRQFEISRESIQLLLRPAQHVQGDVQGCHILIGLRQPDVRLRLRLIPVLRLQSRRQGRLIDIADGRQVVVANPVPQLQLPFRHDRLFVHHLRNRLHLIALRLHIVHLSHNTQIRLAASESDQHAHAHPHAHPLGNGVGEQPLQGHRQYQVGVVQHIIKILRKGTNLQEKSQ